MRKSRFIDYSLHSEDCFIWPRQYYHATSKQKIERIAKRNKLIKKSGHILTKFLFGTILALCVFSMYIGFSILASY